MPGSIKLKEELGDRFELMFVESQGATAEQAEAFAYERGWMQAAAMWTIERPANSGMGGLPSFVLLDKDGKVLLKGNTADMKGKIEDAIAEQIELIEELPSDVPKAYKKAWRSFVEGDYGQATAELVKIEAKGGEDAEAAARVRESFETRLASEFSRLEYLLEHGLFIEAAARAEGLGERIEGLAEDQSRLADLVAQLESAELVPEVEAAEELEKLMVKIREDGIEDNRKKLEKLASKLEGTKAGERAQRLLSLPGS